MEVQYDYVVLFLFLYLECEGVLFICQDPIPMKEKRLLTSGSRYDSMYLPKVGVSQVFTSQEVKSFYLFFNFGSCFCANHTLQALVSF